MHKNFSVSIGGSIFSSAIQAGDNNQTNISFQDENMTESFVVDITHEIAAMKAILISLEGEDKGKLERAIADVEDEFKKDQPNKDEIGNTLERAMTYAQRLNGFAEAMGKLQPHIRKSVIWLGGNWHKLLVIVGLAT